MSRLTVAKFKIELMRYTRLRDDLAEWSNMFFAKNGAAAAVHYTRTKVYCFQNARHFFGYTPQPTTLRLCTGTPVHCELTVMELM